ncbi:MAG: hypothetical protein U0521_23320 [Anaerolineae bacterium]
MRQAQAVRLAIRTAEPFLGHVFADDLQIAPFGVLAHDAGGAWLLRRERVGERADRPAQARQPGRALRRLRADTHDLIQHGVIQDSDRQGVVVAGQLRCARGGPGCAEILLRDRVGREFVQQAVEEALHVAPQQPTDGAARLRERLQQIVVSKWRWCCHAVS